MIGLLNAYHCDEENAPPYQLEYGPMCEDFLRRVLPGQAVTTFQVALGKKPESVDQCEAWIITGSPKAAYDKDLWITELGEFVRQIHDQKKKLIGICFGHQLIAHYLGGQTAKSDNGWGVGVHEFRMLKSKPWMRPEFKHLSLLFSHQDQVVKLPPGAELLAENAFCPYQMYTIGNHILSLQGHPEFNTGFAKGRMDSRVAAIGQSKYDLAVKSLSRPTHSTEVGGWMNSFIKGS